MHKSQTCEPIHYQSEKSRSKLKEDREAQDELEKVDSETMQMLSYLTHELRAPLTGILGFSRMLSEEIYGSLNNKQMQYVDAITQSGEHLLALINDLLDISKLEAKKEEIFVETIAVEDICLAAISMVREMAVQQQLDLKLEIDPQVSFCRGDKRRLKQILVNLLSNAIKFTERGSVTLKVKLENSNLVRETPMAIAFSIIDTGIGISPADQKQLFQPFNQISNHLHNKFKGTGLGLAISLKLALLHNGTITCTSELGKGSCFTLHIPV